MAMQFSVPTPHALSETHRRSHTMGKVTVRRCKSPGRKGIPLLEHLSPLSIVLPVFNNTHSRSTRREHRRRFQVRKMTVGQGKPRTKKELPSLQEKRGRMPKPTEQQNSQVSRRHQSSTQGSRAASRTAFRQSMIGPGTRLGATKYAPIIIRDEEEEEVVDREEDSPRYVGLFSNSFVASTPASPRTSIYAPSPSTPSDGSSPIRRSIPSLIGGAWTPPSSTASDEGRYRETSIYVR